MTARKPKTADVFTLAKRHAQRYEPQYRSLAEDAYRHGYASDLRASKREARQKLQAKISEQLRFRAELADRACWRSADDCLTVISGIRLAAVALNIKLENV